MTALVYTLVISHCSDVIKFLPGRSAVGKVSVRGVRSFHELPWKLIMKYILFGHFHLLRVREGQLSVTCESIYTEYRLTAKKV